MHGYMIEVMKLKKFKGTTILATAAIAALGIATLSAGARATEHSLSPESLLPAFNDSAGNTSLLLSSPELVEDAGIIPDSIRLLAVSALGEHWAATTNEGDICLITELDDSIDSTENIAGANCMPAHAFYRFGSSLRVEASNGGVVAHLLPPTVEQVSVPNSQPLSQAGERAESYLPLVVLSTEDADSLGDLQVPLIDGSTLTLTPMSAGI